MTRPSDWTADPCYHRAGSGPSALFFHHDRLARDAHSGEHRQTANAAKQKELRNRRSPEVTGDTPGFGASSGSVWGDQRRGEPINSESDALCCDANIAASGHSRR